MSKKQKRVLKDPRKWPEFQIVIFAGGILLLVISLSIALIVGLTKTFGGFGLIASLVIISVIGILFGLIGNTEKEDVEQ